MKICVPHRWCLQPRQAIALQRKLAAAVSQAKPDTPLRWVAGVDAAFTESRCLAGVVLWDLRCRRVVEAHTATRPLRFPYIPGLLSFREMPAVVAALRKLSQPPDLILCDGQGLAHPRRFGIACHLGVVLGVPTIGCAKSRLIGAHLCPSRPRGSRQPLFEGQERIGTVLRTQDGVRPVYVSVGHRIDLASAEELVLRCAVEYRLPEPTRLADQLVGAFKKAIYHKALRSNILQ